MKHVLPDASGAELASSKRSLDREINILARLAVVKIPGITKIVATTSVHESPAIVMRKGGEW